MTKLTVSEIKGLIEAQGSNRITLEVSVPKHIFSNSEETQKRLIADIAVGTTLAVVESYQMSANQPEPERYPNMYSPIMMLVTIFFSDDLLEEMELTEMIYKKKTSNSFEVKSPLSLIELKELTDKGIHSFVLEILRTDFSIKKDEMNERLLGLISEEIELKDARYSILTDNFLDAYSIKVKVDIPNLNEQVSKILNDQQVLKDLLENPFNGSVELIKERLTASEVYEKFAPAPDYTGEVRFTFLIEVDYESLRDCETYYVPELILGSIFKSTPNKQVLTKYSDKAVGFNAAKGAVIILVSGILVR